MVIIGVAHSVFISTKFYIACHLRSSFLQCLSELHNGATHNIVSMRNLMHVNGGVDMYMLNNVEVCAGNIKAKSNNKL